MASDDPPAQLEALEQKRPLTGPERALLHRVIGMLEGEPGYAYTMRPGLRDVLGDGARPQERDLAESERRGLDDMIRLIAVQWARQDAVPAAGLSGTDVARLALVRRVTSPHPGEGDDLVLVNAADWIWPAGVERGWKIANAPHPLEGPGAWWTWEGADRHGGFYAAWPPGHLDGMLVGEAAWLEANDAREVRVLTNDQIAAEVSRFLAAYGVTSPGEAGLSVPEVARDMGFPWKESGPEAQRAAVPSLAWLLTSPGDGYTLAYDGSNGPQRRQLTGDERAFLSRLIGLAAADPRFASGEIIRRPVVRAVLGDGTRPQAGPLTARERDDIGWLINHIGSEWRHARERPGSEPLSPWAAELSGGDIARLELVGNAITPRHGTPYLDGPVLVNAIGWAPPEPVPDGWVTACAPIPISGPIAWHGPDLGNGEFYAAAPDGDDPYRRWLTECAGAREVEIVTDEDAVAGSYAFLSRYECTAPEQAGMTIADVARDLGYPLPADRADAAVAAARTIWHVASVDPASGRHAWHALHGAAMRDSTVSSLEGAGWEVTGTGEGVPRLPGTARAARALLDHAVRHGLDVEYMASGPGQRPPRAERFIAHNPDTGTKVDYLWSGGRPSRQVLAKKRQEIAASPRPRCIRGPSHAGQNIQERLSAVEHPQASPGGARTRPAPSTRRDQAEFPDPPATSPPRPQRKTGPTRARQGRGPGPVPRP